MSKRKILAIAGLAVSIALGGAANAQDDEDHYHGHEFNHLLHDYGVPHSHGYEGDAHEYNHYLHDNGIPHEHVFTRRCYQVLEHDAYGHRFFRRVCQ